ncbi:efflux RND transporter permease subunit [Streptosporangium sp. NPDC051023]|uniref:efflux RND transporter permease subunit n=1 Tax=Streptosporangium sp. NPDC051023 TaxID=3155410 RepID=UPI00344BC8C5
MTALARLSLANRSLVIMIALVISAFGAYTIPSLKQQLLPSLEFPNATIGAAYAGASPEIVEEEVTEPIEDSLRGIQGITETTSTSTDGFARVQVAFDYGTDIDASVREIEEAVGRLDATLPDGVNPQVRAGSTDDFPALVLAVGDGGDQREMFDKLEKIVVPEIQGFDGVREATVTGSRGKVVEITPDDDELKKKGIPVTAIPALLEANGLSLPAGTLTEKGTAMTVQIGNRIGTAKDLRNLYLTRTVPPAPVAPAAGAGRQGARPAPKPPQPKLEAVKLDDVADVTVKDAEATTLTRTNGRPSLGVSIKMGDDGNVVAISHEVRGKISDWAARLGKGSEINVVYDQAPYVERSIEDLTTEGLLGLAFAVLVILVFLLSLRSTLVTALSIPLSLVIALIALSGFNYSLNLLTLGALTIAVGRVVDDSIVVLENIKRHLGYGEPKRDAILAAVREVASAVTASTVTTVVVFLPIAFVSGLVGELFASFAVTVSVALVASLLVSLTVIPVLAYWFLKSRPLSLQEAQAVRDRELRSPLQRMYLPVLRFATRFRFVTLVLGIAILAGSGTLLPGLRTNLLNSTGRDTITITQRMAPGTDLTTTDAAAKKVEQVLGSVEGVRSYQVNVGSGGLRSLGGNGTSTASYSLTVKDYRATPTLEQTLRDRLASLPGIGDITVGGPQGGGVTPSDQLKVIVYGTDADDLKTGGEAVATAMGSVTGVRDVSSNLADSAPRVQVSVNREDAAKHGLSEAQIGQVVAQQLQGRPIGEMNVDGRASDILLRGDASPDDIGAIKDLELPTSTGSEVKLSEVASVKKVDGPQEITRTDGDRTAVVTGTADSGNLGNITAGLTRKLKSLSLPSGVTYSIGGASADQQDAFNQLGVAMIAAIAIVFMVMVATFRSVVQPIILLVSIPFAATGAIVALRVTDTPLGVSALIGMLMLIGIVVTNAIVLIDLINQYRAQGLGVVEAVLEGGRRRLRPILMTALATVCALVPMAVGLTGSGGFISQALAIVVIGGLVSSTLLTLVLVPTLYTVFERTKERFRRGPRPKPAPRSDPEPGPEPAAKANGKPNGKPNGKQGIAT